MLTNLRPSAVDYLRPAAVDHLGPAPVYEYGTMPHIIILIDKNVY